MNKVILMGRLTAEPERKVTVNGRVKVEFGIAVNKKFKKEGGPQADFFACEAWGTTAETIYQYLHQGDGIMVSGRVENNNYTNRDGVKVYGTVIAVEEFDFGPKKQGTSENRQNGYNNYGSTPDNFSPQVDNRFDEELPFS